MAVAMDTVRASNAGLRDLKPGLVAVFAGGTAGIGEATLRAFAKYARAPKIYLLGRNENSATTIIKDLNDAYSDITVSFIKSDLSLLKNVDQACQDIISKEKTINLIFITTGYLALEGRRETGEGLDMKLALNYYSRFCLVNRLLPQLTSAAEEPNSFSRVVTVLSAGFEGSIVENDLELKAGGTIYFLWWLSRHGVVMNDFACEELANANPGTAFVHTYPGSVKTGIMENSGVVSKYLAKALKVLFTPLSIPLEESGERNLHMATSASFAPKKYAAPDAAIGSDGTIGSGAYLLSWNSKPVGNAKLLKDA